MTALHQAAQKAVEAALRRAFDLGQLYWQQADSASYKQNAKADITQSKFDALVAQTTAALQHQEVPREPDLNCVCGAVWERGANEWEMVHSPRAASPSTPAREEAGVPALDPYGY